MGGFEYSKIKDIIDKRYKIAIETGSCRGDGTLKLSKYFEKVYTIEINEALFEKVKKRFNDQQNKIVCCLGDSKVIIKKLLDDDNIKGENIIFWLDAHWSGDSSVDWKNSKFKGYNFDTGYVGNKINGKVPGPNQVPLEQEIYEIYKNCKNECILYIDDFDKIDKKTLKGFANKCFQGEDYSHLNFNIIFDYINDRIIHKEIAHSYCILKFKSLHD